MEALPLWPFLVSHTEAVPRLTPINQSCGIPEGDRGAGAMSEKRQSGT